MTHLILLALAWWFPLQALPAGFTGTWVADVKGTTFARLELRAGEGGPAGGLAIGNVHFNTSGVVDEAQPVPATLTALANFVVTGGVLAFTRDEGDDTERFEVRVTADGNAQLTFLPTADDLAELKEAGIPAPKPIPMRRVR